MRRRRNGLTLLETIAVVLLLGVVAVVVIARNGQGTIRNLAAQGNARLLSLDLMQAQRRAISSGDNHYVQFTSSGPTVIGWQVFRRDPSGDVAVEDARQVPDAVTYTVSHATMEFDFSGAALAAYQASVVGPQQNRVVSVVPATGAIRILPGP